VAAAFAAGSDVIEPVREPDTIVRSLAIGSPADGGYALDLARSSGGSIEGVPDAETASAIRALGRLEGVQAETAGGVTVAAVAAARRRGVIRPGDKVVALITGNGVKTPDARRFGLEGADDQLPAPIPANLAAFETWLASAG
jgi:threonine synthase